MSGNMMEIRLFSITAALWIVLFLSSTVYAQGGGTCNKGWFGTQCQYVDLSYTQNDGTTKKVFWDADDTTCNGDTNQPTATMAFETTIHFTWLRLYIKNEGLLSNIDVTFIDGNGNSNIPCSNKISTIVDNRTIDIQCDVDIEVKKVAVTSVAGGAVGYLCSFYVSGGCRPNNGWFGSKCQYKCHCANDNCDNNGDCTNGAGCVKGWFGPQCQYVDLSYTENDGYTKEIFRDAEDTTCNTDVNHQTVVMSFKRTFPFTWLRLLFSAGVTGLSSDDIDVTFTDGSGNSNIQCNNRKSALINSRTIDIHCDISVEVKKVNVKGVAIVYLCSFYVSGGRNVALKQSASQGSTQYGYGASNAVDGDPRQRLDSGTCTHTLQSDGRASWTVILSQSNNYVDRYVIYNRGDCCEDRLKGFVLTASNQNNILVFTHNDTESSAQDVYTLTSVTDTSPIRSVNIRATNSAGPPYYLPVLTLCEVEIYGDSLCPVTTYGKECADQCHCANSDPCFVSTGVCPNNDCAVGYTGLHCDQPCPEGFYGKNCQEHCSTNCVDEKCDSSSGRCDQCQAGMTGVFCDQTCSSGKWGPRCVNTCSMNCKVQLCNAVTGRCNDCPSGKTGDQCDQDCPATQYGSRCVNTCSDNCADSKCSGENGRCDQCPDGKNGDQCDTNCPDTQYGPRCVKECSSNCENKRCEGDSGRCIDCLSGMTGETCDKECSNYTYGPRCIKNCSLNCLDRLCDRATGHCEKCIPGKRGDFCAYDCADGKYGDGCKENCSINCKESKQCNSVNGACFDGCSAGYIGELCKDACGVGKYGSSCSSNCSEFCNTTGLTENDTPCHHTNGTCLYGCDDRHDGLDCGKVVQDAPASDDTAPIGAIVGALIGILVVVALIVIGVLFWRRRQNQRKDGTSSILGKNNKKSKSSKTVGDAGFMGPGSSRAAGNPYENVEIAAGTNQVKTASTHVEDEPVTAAKPAIKLKPPAKGKKGDASATYYNTENLGKSQSTAIPIGDLHAFVAAHDKEFFRKQFESIPDNKSAKTKIGQSDENKQKNRYKNICAYDHSRVCLKKDTDKNLGDYINASYIEGYKEEEKFIASQGPTKYIMDDFIRMLWEQKVETVVMLTNLVEEGKMKCEKYWPTDEPLHFADIKMILTTTEVFADYTIRRLKLTKKGEAVQLVTHFHFTSWPDKGVPTHPWGLVDFEQRVASYPTNKPIVVHCSAGVGRTGTFIALRNVMKQAEDTGFVDFFATVQKLRHDRTNMVQTAEQYEFLHRAAQVFMVCLRTSVASADIQDTITKLQSKSKSGQTLMEEEFKAICSVCAGDGESDVKHEPVADNGKVVYENSSEVSNKLKDRLKNVPAKEHCRAILSRENDDMGDYINAVLVPSFRKLEQQILTQIPLPTTVTDFWRLVTQYKVALVVAFDLDCDEKDSSIANYLPLNKDDTMSVPLFNIKSGSISRGEVCEVQQVTVEAVDVDLRRKSMPVFLTGQHQLVHVKYMSTDLNPKKLLALIKEVRQHFPGPEGRVIFTCRNGATYSGLLCVLTLLLDRMDNDLRLTVPLVVGAIKSIRPQVIPTLEQYKLLYQILHIYNESNNVYSNFGESQSDESGNRRVEEEQNKENASIYANS